MTVVSGDAHQASFRCVGGRTILRGLAGAAVAIERPPYTFLGCAVGSKLIWSPGARARTGELLGGEQPSPPQRFWDGHGGPGCRPRHDDLAQALTHERLVGYYQVAPHCSSPPAAWPGASIRGFDGSRKASEVRAPEEWPELAPAPTGPEPRRGSRLRRAGR